MSKQLMLGLRQGGRSILELMMVITLAALMSIFVFPSVTEVMNRAALRSERHTLLQDIRTVRHAAIARRRPAYLCVIGQDGACVRSANWGNGWLGYVDLNSNERFDVADKFLLRRPGPDDSRSIAIFLHARWKDIKFDSRGVLRRSGHLRICNPAQKQAEEMKVIRMNTYGRLAIETDTLACN